jgi:hypothetical protein
MSENKTSENKISIKARFQTQLAEFKPHWEEAKRSSPISPKWAKRLFIIGILKKVALVLFLLSKSWMPEAWSAEELTPWEKSFDRAVTDMAQNAVREAKKVDLSLNDLKDRILENPKSGQQKAEAKSMALSTKPSKK